MKGLETSFVAERFVPFVVLKALTRYEGFGNLFLLVSVFA